MPVRRNFHVTCLLLALVRYGSVAEADVDCGQVLSGPDFSNTIYVFCRTLTDLSKADAHSIVESVLKKARRRADDNRIVFLSDASVLERDRHYQDMERRLESWGDAFIGMYHTNSGLLMYRSSADGKWRNIELGIL